MSHIVYMYTEHKGATVSYNNTFHVHVVYDETNLYTN